MPNSKKEATKRSIDLLSVNAANAAVDNSAATTAVTTAVIPALPTDRRAKANVWRPTEELR